jgi:hypothetical protein
MDTNRVQEALDWFSNKLSRVDDTLGNTISALSFDHILLHATRSDYKVVSSVL